ncbi:hypothetical protein [Fructobacillus cardui]|uniref:hypothetical protein n=1 Tax=Fructobacillus cardui TaxID=2893170 RepID=UPI002DAAEEC3|nr:Predicted membrane glycosyltransferase TK1552 [Fructobacillus cardui]
MNNSNVVKISSVKKITLEILPILVLFFASIIILNPFLFNPIKLPIDTYYHLSRIHNLSGGLFQFLYPQNFSSLGQIGIASNVFYPAIGMQFIVDLIPKSLGSLVTYKLFILLLCLISALVAYLLIRFKYSKNKALSVGLALLWTFLIYPSSSLGEAVAKIGFPLLCYGLLNFQKNGAYKYIAAGLIISSLSHLLTTVFLIFFVFFYYLILLFLNRTKENFIFSTINMLKTGIYSFLGTLCVSIPLIYTTINNQVKTPNIFYFQFQTWMVNINTFSDDFRIYVFIMMLVFSLSVILLMKKVSLAQVLSLVFAVFGTSAIVWEPFVRTTVLSNIQIPSRIFYYAISLCFCFSILLLAERGTSKNGKNVLLTFIFVATAIIGTVVYKDSYPSIDSNSGNYIVTSPKQLKTYVSQGNDGYSIAGLGAFDGYTMNQNIMWSIMNYSDYVPQDSISNQTSSFLRQDDKGKNLVNHELSISNGQNIKTSNYIAKSKSVSFQATKNITNQEISLPIVGYNKLNTSVYIDNQKVDSYIKNGRITIYSSLNANQKVTVRQTLVWWEVIPFIISIVSWLMMVILPIVINKNKHQGVLKNG